MHITHYVISNHPRHDKAQTVRLFRVTGPLWGLPPVTGGFPSQRPVTQSFDVFFDLRLNKRLSKQSGRRWFEMASRSLWRHCNALGFTVHDFLLIFLKYEYFVSLVDILMRENMMIPSRLYVRTLSDVEGIGLLNNCTTRPSNFYAESKTKKGNIEKCFIFIETEGKSQIPRNE